MKEVTVTIKAVVPDNDPLVKIPERDLQLLICDSFGAFRSTRTPSRKANLQWRLGIAETLRQVSSLGGASVRVKSVPAQQLERK